MFQHTIMNYVETSAPADQTLVEWRASRQVATPRRRRIRFTPPRVRVAFA
jgi:hypothetical protein